MNTGEKRKETKQRDDFVNRAGIPLHRFKVQKPYDHNALQKN